MGNESNPLEVLGKDKALQVYLLGSVEFETALALQRLLAFQIAENSRDAALILCEHPPLISVGREGSHDHILFDSQYLRTRGWPVRWVRRGGGCMLHLPGQMAIYPILSLPSLDLGVTQYLKRMHAVLQRVLGDFTIHARESPHCHGLWVGNRMIAGIGIAIHEWISTFGAVLNINPELSFFGQIRTGNGDDGPMTSIERERRGPLRPALVRERLVEYFAFQFGFDRISLFFSHPYLNRRATTELVRLRA